MEKNKLKLLNFKDGQISFDREDLDVDIPKFRRYENEEQAIANRLRSKFLAMKESRKTSASCYAIDQLRQEFKEDISRLQNQIDEIRGGQSSRDIEKVKASFLLNINKIKIINQAYYKVINKTVNFYVIITGFSNNIISKISKMEIELSIEFPTLSIEVMPCFDDEWIKEKSDNIWRIK